MFTFSLLIQFLYLFSSWCFCCCCCTRIIKIIFFFVRLFIRGNYTKKYDMMNGPKSYWQTNWYKLEITEFSMVFQINKCIHMWKHDCMWLLKFLLWISNPEHACVYEIIYYLKILTENRKYFKSFVHGESASKKKTFLLISSTSNGCVINRPNSS